MILQKDFDRTVRSPTMMVGLLRTVGRMPARPADRGDSLPQSMGTVNFVPRVLPPPTNLLTDPGPLDSPHSSVRE
jgi:hypothetical protein